MKATLETRGGQTVGIDHWIVWGKCLGKDTYLGIESEALVAYFI